MKKAQKAARKSDSKKAPKRATAPKGAAAKKEAGSKTPAAKKGSRNGKARVRKTPATPATSKTALAKGGKSKAAPAKKLSPAKETAARSQNIPQARQSSKAAGASKAQTAVATKRGKTHASPAPSVLLCRLDHRSAGWVTLTWEDTGSRKKWSYRVDAEPLRRLAIEIRGEPGNAGSQPKEGRLQALERITTDYSSANTAYREALHALARTGAELHRAAMGLEGRTDSTTSAVSVAFQNWFDANVLSAPRGDWRIVMVHTNFDDKGIVPWGLAFALRKSAKNGFERIEDLPLTAEGLSGFWCMGFALSVVGVDYQHENSAPLQLEPEQTHVGVIIELEEGKVDAYSREDRLTHVLDKPDMLHEHVKRHVEKHIFLYVSLNAEGGVYRLDDGEFEGHDFVTATTKHRRVVFAMLDGDCVIRGDRGLKWIQSLLARRDRGVFAVETDISSVQQRFFGWTFMRDSIDEGEALIDGVALARRKHWPRSLLYGLYCTPMQAAMKPAKGFRGTTTIIDSIIDHHSALLKQKVQP